MGRAISVEEYLETLEHAHKVAVLRLRELVGGLPGLTERVKWNAPSYAVDDVDRVTFRLHPKDQLMVVLHCGTAGRPGGVQVPDPDGLLSWSAPDRATVTFTDLADVEARAGAFTTLVAHWLAA